MDVLVCVRSQPVRLGLSIEFDVDQKTGDVLGIEQSVGLMASKNYIPVNKSLYYRTTSINGDPSGRSILRNAYTSYEYLNNLQAIEAIAVERELGGYSCRSYSR